MKKNDIVDLSQRIIKEREFFKLETKVDDVTNILPDVKHRADVWYVLGEVTFCTHVGTHIEAPFHHVKEGVDVSGIQVHKLIGNCVVLDFVHKGHQEAITLDELKEYNNLFHGEDILFVRTGMDKYYVTPRWMELPYLTEEATHWLIKDKGIACLGTDAAGLEKFGTDYQPIHTILFKAGIPMIESLTNLEKIENGKYIVCIFPLSIEGLDACPIRVIAINRKALLDMLQKYD
jgi:arylformamidase